MAAGFDRHAYLDPRPRPWVIHAVGAFNHSVILPWILRLSRVEIGAADLARLRAVVRPGTAAFLAPNHPEFMTDWMIDKEVSRRVAPLMAHWAAYDIVNASPSQQAFWLANNLIANVSGGGGKEYSVRWALAGHGVLLHPEGTVSWHAERIETLVSGVVDMAWETCRRVREAGVEKPVFVVPLVWKLRFMGDVGPRLAREIDRIEGELGLASSAGRRVEERFAALQWSLLARQCEALGIALPSGARDGSYFDAQRAALAAVCARFEARFGAIEGDVPHALHVARRELRRAAGADPRERRAGFALADELERLWRFPPELYARPTLTQEAIAENLKRTRAALVTRGFKNQLHNTVPRAVAPRVARIAAPEPLAVHERFTADPDAAAAARAGLLGELRRRMQETLDGLLAEIAPEVDRWRRPNPLAAGAPVDPLQAAGVDAAIGRA